MSRRSISLATVALAVLASALALFVALSSSFSARPATAAFPGTNSKIAFASFRYLSGFYSEIHTMNPDGSMEQLLFLCGGAGCDSPAWSPDGSRLAFMSYAPHQLAPPFVDSVNADGSGFVGLLPYPGFGYNPAWAPDGIHIVFEEFHYAPPAYSFEIWTADTLSHSVSQITNSGALNYSPVWSPDSTKIAFSSDRDGNNEIYVMNADGSNQTRLTNQAGNDIHPDWSPDGSKLVFASDRDGNYEIYTMNADGSGQTRITNVTGKDELPVWSPDGTKIAFTSNRDGNREIYVMDADGSNQVNTTNDPYDDFGPDWQPIPLPATPTPSATATPLPATVTSTPTPGPVGGVSADLRAASGDGGPLVDWRELALGCLTALALAGIGWTLTRRRLR